MKLSKLQIEILENKVSGAFSVIEFHDYQVTSIIVGARYLEYLKQTSHLGEIRGKLIYWGAELLVGSVQDGQIKVVAEGKSGERVWYCFVHKDIDISTPCVRETYTEAHKNCSVCFDQGTEKAHIHNHPEKMIGYWPGYEESDVHPINDNWKLENQNDYLSVVNYLDDKSNWEFKYYYGFSSCRVCGCSNGSSDMVGGGFRIPVGYSHYIKEHGLVPPDELIDASKKSL